MLNKKYKSTDFYRSQVELMSQDNLLHENMNLVHDCRSFSDLKTVTGFRVTNHGIALWAGRRPRVVPVICAALLDRLAVGN